MSYINFSFNSEKKVWEETKLDKTVKYKSCTDTSKWKPNYNLNNCIDGATSTEIDITKYQFKDGVDTGDRYYQFTSKSADITEKQSAYDKLKNEANIDNDKLNKEFEKQIEIAEEELNKNNTKSDEITE